MLGSAAGDEKKQQPVSEGLDFFKLIPLPLLPCNSNTTASVCHTKNKQGKSQ